MGEKTKSAKHLMLPLIIQWATTELIFAEDSSRKIWWNSEYENNQLNSYEHLNAYP